MSPMIFRIDKLIRMELSLFLTTILLIPRNHSSVSTKRFEFTEDIAEEAVRATSANPWRSNGVERPRRRLRRTPTVSPPSQAHKGRGRIAGSGVSTRDIAPLSFKYHFCRGKGEWEWQ